jgi:aldose 1-epimerase
MTRCLLEREGLRLEIDAALGGAITGLWLRSPIGDFTPLLRPTPPGSIHARDTACFVMAPWVNRFPGGVLVFGGERHVLPANWPGDGPGDAPNGGTLHGLAHARAWRVLDRSPVSARLALDARGDAAAPWPWDWTGTLRYELRPGGLDARIEVTNASARPMPCGVGFHPYFPRVLWDARDRVRVRLPATGRYPLRAHIPTGDARDDDLCRALRDGTTLDAHAPLDDVFTLHAGAWEIIWPASGVRATFEVSAELAHAVLYAPASGVGGACPWFCVEPVSMATDAFGLAARGEAEPARVGARTLGACERLGATWRLRVERVHGAA